MIQADFQYRGYTIYFEGSLYAAQPAKSDDDSFIHLSSKDILTVLCAVDTLYNIDDTMPSWFEAWCYKESSDQDCPENYIDLDKVLTPKLPESLTSLTVAPGPEWPLSPEQMTFEPADGPVRF